MGLPEDFVGSMTSCMNPTFTFPGIAQPGLGNFALGCFLSTFAGINFILQFIPPTPSAIANLQPPGISLFLSAFLSGISLPAAYPSISMGPLTIPAVGDPPYERDVSGELKLMVIVITLPFQLITNMVTKLFELTIALPTLSGVYNLFVSLAIQAGLAGVAVAQFGLCIAQVIFNLFSSLI